MSVTTVKLDTSNPWPNGDTVPVSAYDLEPFMKNPVVLRNFDQNEPIGRVIDTVTDLGNNEILLYVNLSKAGSEILEVYEQTKVLWTWAPQIAILECHWEASGDGGVTSDRRIVDKCELMAVSLNLVPVRKA